jgi:hypothetical protein
MVISSSLWCHFCGLDCVLQGGTLEIFDEERIGPGTVPRYQLSKFVWHSKRMIRPYAKIFVDDFVKIADPEECCQIFASARLCHVPFLENLRWYHYDTCVMIQRDCFIDHLKFYCTVFRRFDHVRKSFMLYKLFKKRRRLGKKLLA